MVVSRKVAEGSGFYCGQCGSFAVFAALNLRFLAVICGCRAADKISVAVV